MCTRKHTHTYTHTCTHKHTHTHAHTNTHTRIHTHAHTYVRSLEIQPSCVTRIIIIEVNPICSRHLLCRGSPRPFSHAQCMHNTYRFNGKWFFISAKTKLKTLRTFRPEYSSLLQGKDQRIRRENVGNVFSLFLAVIRRRTLYHSCNSQLTSPNPTYSFSPKLGHSCEVFHCSNL